MVKLCHLFTGLSSGQCGTVQPHMSTGAIIPSLNSEYGAMQATSSARTVQHDPLNAASPFPGPAQNPTSYLFQLGCLHQEKDTLSSPCTSLSQWELQVLHVSQDIHKCLKARF